LIRKCDRDLGGDDKKPIITGIKIDGVTPGD